MHDEIRQAVDETWRVDTHAHLFGPIRDLRAAAIPHEDVDKVVQAAPHRVFSAGCEALYGVNVGPVLTTKSPKEVFDRAAELRKRDQRDVFARAFEVARIESQFCFCDYKCSDAAAKRRIAPHVRLLAYIDTALVGTPEKGETRIDALERLHGPLDGLGAFLAVIDRYMDGWRSEGVVGMKVSLAYYDHGLDLRDPSLKEAEQAFARRREMSVEDARCVRDFALRHALDACLRNKLPVVIHTGFQAHGQTRVIDANPALLQPVFMNPRWKDLTFVILHGGYPYTGETTFLAARIPNVVIDFTALPWDIPSRFRFALAEWIEKVPFEKFVWGSDSSAWPESIVGIDRLSRGAIADVLEREVDDGVIDTERALRFVELSFRGNARRIFGLTEDAERRTQ